jgi:hypothetical protein
MADLSRHPDQGAPSPGGGSAESLAVSDATVLGAALVATAVMAIVMPVYYLNESSRQAAAAETFAEIAEERGEHWYQEHRTPQWNQHRLGGTTPKRHHLSIR